MNETTRRMARLIDLSAVQATNTEEDVRHCAALASRYRIISVHVLPCWTRFLSTLLPERGQADVMIGRPVGFPGGGQTTDLKVQEVRQLIAEGANLLPIRASTNTTCAASSCSNSSTARRSPSTNSLTLLARSLFLRMKEHRNERLSD